MPTLLLLSGPAAVGKTVFCDAVCQRFDGEKLSTRAMLRALGADDDRAAMIAKGNALDAETDGRWVADHVDAHVQDADAAVLIIDAVRKHNQLTHLRALALSKRWPVVHVHLTAPDALLSERYLSRATATREFASYDELKATPIEREVRSLASEADVIIATDQSAPASLVAYALSGTSFLPAAPERLVDVIVGGQYGSEGKGHICAHLAPGYDLLMRVGGPNAGHKVAHPAYKYIQLPSGTQSNTRAQILIGAGATISVPQLLREIEGTGLTPARLSIDPNAMIIEDSDRAYEQASLDVIGSTKQGVGVATARKILGRDGAEHLRARVRLAKDVPDFKDFLRSTGALLERAYASRQRVLLEGTQGTSLSLHHGPWPNVTSRETTASGCLADAGIGPLSVRRVIMVCRTYPIRVGGTSGPMEQEITFEAIAERAGLPLQDIQRTEVGSVSGNTRRIGAFEWEQLRRAAIINGATDVALTFTDYLASSNQTARRYDQLSAETKNFIADVERVANAPVSLISTRFHPRGVIDRRSWR